MSINDQGDGFYESPWFCGKCGPGECMCTLKPDGTEHKGRIVEHEKDVWDRTHGKIGFRLAKGFSVWKASEK